MSPTTVVSSENFTMVLLQWVGGAFGLVCVEGVKQRAQYAALRGAGTEAEGRGCVTTHSHPLAAIVINDAEPPP